jgi:hypothetical protein
METLKDILWPIVLVGGLGAFIDFLICKTGQERAKDFLLRWWVSAGITLGEQKGYLQRE